MSGSLKVRKVPLRKCVATNEQHPKMEMFRIVRTPENEVVIDLTGKVRGHGAYLSKKKSAIMLAKRKQILHYWESDNTAEVDFLIQKDSHVIPVECKAGNHMKK